MDLRARQAIFLQRYTLQPPGAQNTGRLRCLLNKNKARIMSVICILLVNSHLLFNVTEKVILEAGCLSDISDPSVFITKYPQGYSVTQGREDRTAHEEKTSCSREHPEDRPFPTESTML